MIHTNLEKWCATMLKNEGLNDAYVSGLEELVGVSHSLLEHPGCHNNPLWDCACEFDMTSRDFTYEVLDHIMGSPTAEIRSVLTEIIVDYMAHMDNKTDELFDIHQDTQRRLDRLQYKMREVYKEAERQGYTEIENFITSTEEGEE